MPLPQTNIPMAKTKQKYKESSMASVGGEIMIKWIGKKS